MTALGSKHPRLRLDPKAYRLLRLMVLERDHWRCQACGSLSSLEVHHIETRGQLGADCEENLITLCSNCHRKLHQSKIK
jgi:5-methylcytosine-specific restriction endonuclease McrA